MCCAEFIVKYVLFGANLIFALAGVALVGVGVAVLVQLTDVLELIPVNVNAIPIFIIVIGCIVFLIAFFGCCGAIKESRCLLVMYFVCMGILAAAKIYVATVIFRSLSEFQQMVTDWLEDAFVKDNLRPAFHVMETFFQCCGTSGPGSYNGVLPALPPSCCAGAAADASCVTEEAFDGCSERLSNYFGTFGEAIGISIIIIITIELVAMIFGMFLCWSVGNKSYNRR